VNITTQALENREHVRRLLEKKPPQFAAVLKSAERELSCPICLGTVAGRQLPAMGNPRGSLSLDEALRRAVRAWLSTKAARCGSDSYGVTQP